MLNDMHMSVGPTPVLLFKNDTKNAVEISLFNASDTATVYLKGDKTVKAETGGGARWKDEDVDFTLQPGDELWAAASKAQQIDLMYHSVAATPPVVTPPVVTPPVVTPPVVAPPVVVPPVVTPPTTGGDTTNPPANPSWPGPAFPSVAKMTSYAVAEDVSSYKDPQLKVVSSLADVQAAYKDTSVPGVVVREGYLGNWVLDQSVQRNAPFLVYGKKDEHARFGQITGLNIPGGLEFRRAMAAAFAWRNSKKLLVERAKIAHGGNLFDLNGLGKGNISKDVTVRYSQIHNPTGDAFFLSGILGALLEYNEIWGVNENGQHNDVLQGYAGEGTVESTVFQYNYVHDCDGQGWFLKDLPTLNNWCLNNIFARFLGPRMCIDIFGGSKGARVENNALVDHAQGIHVFDDVLDAIIKNNISQQFEDKSGLSKDRNRWTGNLANKDPKVWNGTVSSGALTFLDWPTIQKAMVNPGKDDFRAKDGVEGDPVRGHTTTVKPGSSGVGW